MKRKNSQIPPISTTTDNQLSPHTNERKTKTTTYGDRNQGLAWDRHNNVAGSITEFPTHLYELLGWLIGVKRQR